jgi:hypothetical protein
MSPLELLRWEQHNDATTPSDVELMRFLGTVTRKQVQQDLTHGLNHDERALYRFHTGGHA